MGKTHARGRAVALGFVLAVILLTRPFALALNPGLDASQYAHTAWKVREGFTKGFIYAITQTPDGYLWLATEFGLLRFDGVPCQTNRSSDTLRRAVVPRASSR